MHVCITESEKKSFGELLCNYLVNSVYDHDSSRRGFIEEGSVSEFFGEKRLHEVCK